MKKLGVVLVLTLVTVACSPLERQAYNTVVGAKAFLDVTRSNHPECQTPEGAPTGVCLLIARAVAAKDTLIDAAELYCASPEFDEQGGTCTPAAKGTPARDLAEAKLKAAIQAYSQVEKDVKGVIH